jgi:hypothetical protein
LLYLVALVLIQVTQLIFDIKTGLLAQVKQILGLDV